MVACFKLVWTLCKSWWISYFPSKVYDTGQKAWVRLHSINMKNNQKHSSKKIQTLKTLKKCKIILERNEVISTAVQFNLMFTTEGQRLLLSLQVEETKQTLFFINNLLKLSF
jgi:hypothetical protein